MPTLGNRAVRVSKNQLHKLQDLLGAVLSKDESERKSDRREKVSLCFGLPAAAGIYGAPAGLCR